METNNLIALLFLIPITGFYVIAALIVGWFVWCQVPYWWGLMRGAAASKGQR